MVQCERVRDKEPPSCKSPPAIIPLSAIYNGLKSFKNKLIKVIHSVPTPRLSSENAKDKCVTSNRQRIRSLQKEEKRKFFDRANGNDVSKCIDIINEEPSDSTDISLMSDAFAQAEITTSHQEDDKNSADSSCRNVSENSVRTGPLSSMNDNRHVVHSNQVTDELSRGRVKQTFRRNKSKKYKICSCGSQCPYVLYKLPCCNQNSAPGKKTDNEVGGLTLECSSFEEKNNFPKFVNIDTGLEDCNGCPSDSVESSTSSISVDLEVNVCGNYDRLKENEFSRRRGIHVINGTRARENDDAIGNFRSENKPPMCVNLERDQQGYRTRTADFTHDYRSIRGYDKQVQYSPATLRAVGRASVRTSTPGFRQSGLNLLTVITPRRTKMNMHTQTGKRSHFKRARGIDLLNGLDARNEENIDENEDKKILRNKNAFDICHLPRQKIWPRTKRHDAQFALRMEEKGETYSNKPSNQVSYLNYRRDGVAPLRTSCPYHCDRVLTEKRERLAILMSRLAEYYPSHRMLDFDMSNVSDRLYGCLEKVEDITA